MTDSNDHWLIQLAIIEEIATQPEASIERLHFGFIEKLGRPPDFEHIDYFVTIINTPDNDILRHLKYIGRAEPKRTDGTRVGGRRRARSISSGNISDEQLFRQAFEREYGRPPSEQFVQHCLQKTQQSPGETPAKDTPAQNAPDDGEKHSFAFIDKIAEDPQVTVLKFRKQFNKAFGTAPSEELIQYFLLKTQEKKVRSLTGSSEMHFAETGADGSLTTVLEFRRSFLQEFDKIPDVDMTKAFITGLTSRR